MLHLKLLEKQEQAKPKASRREIIKIWVKINETETKKQKQRIDKTKKPGSLKKINKTDKLLGNLTKVSRKRPKLVKSEMKKGR
jgi:hypothetical protein